VDFTIDMSDGRHRQRKKIQVFGFVSIAFKRVLSGLSAEQLRVQVDVEAGHVLLRAQRRPFNPSFLLMLLPMRFWRRTGMSEQIPADGGFLLQPEWANQIVDRAYQQSAVLMRCTEWRLSKNGLKFPAIDEVSRVDGSRWGGNESVLHLPRRDCDLHSRGLLQ
jgi:HK97 family phage major capsid protein